MKGVWSLHSFTCRSHGIQSLLSVSCISIPQVGSQAKDAFAYTFYFLIFIIIAFIIKVLKERQQAAHDPADVLWLLKVRKIKRLKFIFEIITEVKNLGKTLWLSM